MTVEKLAVKLFSSSRKISQTSSVISRNQTVFFRYTHVHVKCEYIGKGRGTINKLHTCDLISGRDFRVQNILRYERVHVIFATTFLKFWPHPCKYYYISVKLRGGFAL